MAGIWGELTATSTTYKYKWLIHDFIEKNLRVGEAIKSETFMVQNLSRKYYWQLWLYPKGNSEKFKDCCSICLFNCHNSRCFRATVTFSLLDKRGEILTQTVVRDVLFALGQAKGEKRFFSRNYVLSKESCALDNDRLTVLAEISIGDGSTRMVAQQELSVQSNAAENAPQEAAAAEKADEKSLRLREFDDFEELVDEKSFSDVLFIVAGHTLYAHKCILAARSSVFAAMFLHNMRESQENKVVVQDVDYDVFREMLRFVYTGKIDRMEAVMAHDLLIVADKYGLESLIKLTERVLCSKLSSDTAVMYLQLADRHRAKNLRSQAVEFIVQHANNIINSEEFKAMPNEFIIEICSAMATKIK